jgi:predicted nuclease of predicted toxin-antitoxin system
VKLFSDACVYRATEEAVVQWGHDLELARDVGLADASNGAILAHAVATGRVLLTRDMHFSSILLYPPDSHRGIIVLKIRPAWMNEVHAVLERFLATISPDEMRGALAIVDRSKWRLRRA